MQKLYVAESSSYLKNAILGNIKQIDGSTLVVFENSFILKFGIDDLIHITNEKENLSPFSLYVEDLHAKDLYEATKVCWHYNQFLIDEIFVELNTETKEYDETILKPIDINKIKLPSINHSQNIFSEKFNQYRDELLISYEKNDFDKCSQCLIKFIGLGDGLTPCGDDYLLGMIYALQCVENKELITLLKHILYRYVSSLTNVISKKFIFHALKGRFSKIIIDQDWETLLRYGHNSGYYTLLGIKDTAKQFCKNLIVS